MDNSWITTAWLVGKLLGTSNLNSYADIMKFLFRGPGRPCSHKPLGPWSNIIIRLSGLNRQNRPAAPPPLFVQTCSEVGEERDEFSPIQIDLPKEARSIMGLNLM